MTLGNKSPKHRRDGGRQYDIACIYLVECWFQGEEPEAMCTNGRNNDRTHKGYERENINCMVVARIKTNVAMFD